MPRRRVADKRDILPDPIFSSELISKFVNCVMRDGKKSVAEKIVYGALRFVNERMLKQKVQDKPEEEGGEEGGGASSVSLDYEAVLAVFEQALDNIRPSVEVRPRRVGGATYQIPVEVRPVRRNSLGMRWLIFAATQRSEKVMSLRLGAEILDAYNNKGIAVRRREDTYRMAKANQVFGHLRSYG